MEQTAKAHLAEIDRDTSLGCNFDNYLKNYY
ncbi:unnamed protein product [Nezara viridula]|uniref:Uncharacterized protein n=1 Tax=Nezara viridula TaxID=85310 RepID=A0A9P0HD34_NEZVI|nr:unnamed protein product [Nezara viridula]CAH1399605.1 unnamed protein product [Nezara viridula]